MRGANTYQSLNDTHERLGAETNPPGLRYEALRETLQEVDRDPVPALMRVIDNLETRRAELDRELSDLREAGRSPEPVSRVRDEQADIDQALALRPADASPHEEATRTPGERDAHIAPEQWTDKGGMVEQQASAMDWLQHKDELRRGQAGQEGPRPGSELSQEDRDLLSAARATEEQTRQQDHIRSQIHEPSGP